MIILYILYALGFLQCIHGSCNLRIEGTEGYNVNRNPNGDVKSCEYVDSLGRSLKISVGTSQKNMETCEECTCSASGALQCCGIGHRAGVIGLMPECEMKKVDNCNFIIVTKKDAPKPCAMATKTTSIPKTSNGTTSRPIVEIKGSPKSQQDDNGGSNDATTSHISLFSGLLCIVFVYLSVYRK